MEFHKNTLKVMLVLITLGFVLDFGNRYMFNNIVKPLTEETISQTLGSEFLNCMKLITKQTNGNLNNTQVKSAQNKADMYEWLLLIVKVGVTYLSSCFIVRLISKSDSKRYS